MNIKQIKFGTNFWIVFSTILLLGFGYLFYLKVYVAEKESRIISSDFRVLNQIGANIDTKLKVYDSNVKNLFDTIGADINKSSPADFNKSLIKVTESDTSDIGSHNYFKNLKKNNYVIHTPSRGDTIAFKVSYKTLMQGLVREDIFDELILIDSSTVIYNSLGQDIQLSNSAAFNDIIHSSLAKEGDENKNSSLFATETNSQEDFIFSGKAFDLTISNIEYKAFLKPIKANKQHWYIVGLIEKSKYNAARLSIAPGIIILLSMLLVLIILGMPIIKLKVLSKTEQLTTGTIINFATSTLLGGALITLSVFFVIENYSHRTEIDNKLKVLSTEINTNFICEIENSLDQLKAFDIYYRPQDTIKFNLGENILDNSNTLYPNDYPYADYYFWVDKSGVQKKGLTVKKDIGNPSDLSKRDYINKKDEWYFTRENNTVKFRIESIVSVSSGTIKAALSTSSDSSIFPTIALSAKFHSVIDPIIPINYSFCIIDNFGKVWFHSDKNRNLNENLIDECNENKYLEAALYRKTSKAINVDYYNKPYRIYIKPIGELPLYLVTFYNKKTDNSFQAQTTTITMLLLGSLFLMLFIQLSALLIIEGKNADWTVAKNIIMRLSRPLRHHNSTYKYLLTVNIILFILIIPLFIFWLNNVMAVFAVFTLVVCLFTYMYWMLNKTPEKKTTRQLFTYVNLALLIFINIISYNLLNGIESIQIIVFQLIIVLTLFVCHIVYHRHLNTQAYFHSGNYINNYTKFLLTLLIILGLLPTLTFFKVAHNTELEIRTKHNQIDLMRQREKRNIDINKYYKKIDPTYSSSSIKSVLEQRKELGIYTKFLDNTDFSEMTSGSIEGDKNNIWDTLVCYFRPFYDREIIENKYVIFNRQKESGMSWHKENDSIVMRYTSLTEDPLYKKLLNRSIKTTVHELQFYLPFHTDGKWSIHLVVFNILFCSIIVLILLVFYFIIKYGVRKVFCLDVVEGYSHQLFSERVSHYLFTGNNLMITRLSIIDETNGFSKKLSSEDGYYYLNWRDEGEVNESTQLIETELKRFINNKTSQTKGENNNSRTNNSLIIVLDHFDWNYHDSDNFLNRMSIIQQYDNRDGIIIIALSQSSEETILKYYDNLIDQKIAAKKDADKLIKTKGDFENLLSKMEIIRQPINYKHSYINEESYCGSTQSTMEAKELIKEELSASDYLEQLKPAMTNYYTNHCQPINCENKEERVLRRITQLAERYYTDLLNSCSIEEKYVLYDTAADLIINPKNEVSIISLLKKGLLVKKCNRINFMNVSFRRFVLQSLNKSETTYLESKMGKSTGTWKGYRTMLTIIIAALFLFIGLANQDFLANLNELFIAVAAGIAGVTGILSKLSANHNPSD